jgi:hypothetical protein
LDASADIAAEELRPVSISRAKIGNGHVHRPVEPAVT